MSRLFLSSCVVCILLTSSALGTPIISIGTYEMSNLNQEYRIPIAVSSGAHERIEGMNLAVQIGDGGLANGGKDTTPRITGIDIVGPGTVFNASNWGSTPIYLGVGQENQPPYLIGRAETVTASGDLDANGVLAYLTVNPEGAAIGSSYRISLQNVGANNANGPWSTDFAGIPASFTANDGWIVIVPEPSIGVLLLAAVGTLLFTRKRR